MQDFQSRQPNDAAQDRFVLDGIHLALPKGLAIPDITEKLRDGSYEAAEARAANRCVKPGFRVLELGAGIGYVTALCARLAGPRNVLSVEANPDLVPVIETTLARNGLDDVSVLHAAVTGRADEGATTVLRVSKRFTASALDGKGARAVEVPLVSVHDLLEAQKPHVVLMDIEGAEADLFDRPWNCPLRFCVMELHPKKYGPEVVKRIFDAMSAMDMTYDPAVSRGKVVGFRKVWRSDGE